MTTDPRRITTGHDVRRFAIEAEDAMRLEAFAARTGAVIEATIVPQGVRVVHTTATGKSTEVIAESGPEAIRLLANAVAASEAASAYDGEDGG